MRFFLALFLLFTSSVHAMEFHASRATNSAGQAINLIRMNGVFDTKDWKRWLYMMTEIDPALDTLVIATSPGGNAAGGFKLYERIETSIAEAHARGKKLALLVEKDCSSMCVALYYTFEDRFALPATRIGIHGISNELALESEFTAQYLDYFRTRAQARHDTALSIWLDTQVAHAVFAGSELQARTAKERAEENSGLVTAAQLVESEATALDRL